MAHGSWGTASALPAIHDALRRLREALGLPASGVVDIPAALRAQGAQSHEVEGTLRAPGSSRKVFDQIRHGQLAIGGPQYPDYTSFSFIAHFAEVLVEPGTRRIRVSRVVSVADCGRVVSPRTAESQVRGGVVWGIGAALREETEVDPRFGGWLNNDLADYVVAVNADIGTIDVGFVDRPDLRINSLGAKGLGEVAMVGCAGAVANELVMLQ